MEAAANGESKIDWRKGGDRILPWFFVIYGKLVRSSLPSSAKDSRKWNWYLPILRYAIPSA